MGAVCISILILQDLVAVGVLAFIRTLGQNTSYAFSGFVVLIIKLLIFIAFLGLFEQYILRRIMMKVERIHELLFVSGLAWCFGVATAANKLGFSYETGAFIAGVLLARHPISFFISEKLKPLRDFFLVLFFVSLGAEFQIFNLKAIWLPALLLAVMFMFMKPWLFKKFFIMSGEKKEFANETGMRLGQLSEFSLLIAMLALDLNHISINASQFIQLVTIITFVISSYIIVQKYPTPIGTSEKLIRD